MHIWYYAFVNLVNLNQKSTLWTWINSIYQSYLKQQNKNWHAQLRSFSFHSNPLYKIDYFKIWFAELFPSQQIEVRKKQIEQETTVVR